jgi:hypothetical protein
MSVEKSVEWELAGEIEVLGENLPQCHFVHHKSPTRPDLGLKTVRRGGKPVTNRLSNGTAIGFNLAPLSLSTADLYDNKIILLSNGSVHKTRC